MHAHRAVALGAAAVLVLSGCKGGNVTGYRLKRDADQVSSIATDAQLTAHATVKHQATGAYTRVHASELGKQAGKLASVLASAHPPQRFAGKTRDLVVIARRLSQQLEQLENHPGDRALARELERAFDKASKQAEKIGQAA
jgi:hypothetical protein